MKTQQFIAVCLLAGASLVISKTSSAQIRLGIASSAHLNSAVAVSTPSVRNALHTSTAAAAATASRAQNMGTAAARQIKGKTTASISVQASSQKK
ncbi:MAG TPA: hypothetical protein VGM31_03120 [Puia sp.]|jgi:hypothetical protein